MSKTKLVTFKATPDEIKKMDETARRYGLTRSRLIKFLVSEAAQILRIIKRHHTLPPEE